MSEYVPGALAIIVSGADTPDENIGRCVALVRSDDSAEVSFVDSKGDHWYVDNPYRETFWVVEAPYDMVVEVLDENDKIVGIDHDTIMAFEQRHLKIISGYKPTDDEIKGTERQQFRVTYPVTGLESVILVD